MNGRCGNCWECRPQTPLLCACWRLVAGPQESAGDRKNIRHGSGLYYCKRGRPWIGTILEAAQIVARVLEIDPANSEALDLREAIRLRQKVDVAPSPRGVAELLEACRKHLRAREYNDAVAASEELLRGFSPDR